MNTPKAQKIIKKILDDLDHAGIITNTLVNDLKELRPYAVEEKRPVLAKAIRLTFEHVEAYDTFDIPIPEEEPFEEDSTVTDEENDDEDVKTTTSEGNEEEEILSEEPEMTPFSPKESLTYLISLLKDSDNKLNLQELREYNEALNEYAEMH